MLHDDRALHARVVGDAAQRLLDRPPDDVDAELLVVVVHFQAVELGLRAQ